MSINKKGNDSDADIILVSYTHKRGDFKLFEDQSVTNFMEF